MTSQRVQYFRVMSLELRFPSEFPSELFDFCQISFNASGLPSRLWSSKARLSALQATSDNEHPSISLAGMIGAIPADSSNSAKVSLHLRRHFPGQDHHRHNRQHYLPFDRWMSNESVQAQEELTIPKRKSDNGDDENNNTATASLDAPDQTFTFVLSVEDTPEFQFALQAAPLTITAVAKCKWRTLAEYERWRFGGVKRSLHYNVSVSQKPGEEEEDREAEENGAAAAASAAAAARSWAVTGGVGRVRARASKWPAEPLSFGPVICQVSFSPGAEGGRCIGTQVVKADFLPDMESNAAEDDDGEFVSIDLKPLIDFQVASLFDPLGPAQNTPITARISLAHSTLPMMVFEVTATLAASNEDLALFGGHHSISPLTVGQAEEEKLAAFLEQAACRGAVVQNFLVEYIQIAPPPRPRQADSARLLLRGCFVFVESFVVSGLPSGVFDAVQIRLKRKNKKQNKDRIWSVRAVSIDGTAATLGATGGIRMTTSDTNDTTVALFLRRKGRRIQPSGGGGGGCCSSNSSDIAPEGMWADKQRERLLNDKCCKLPSVRKLVLSRSFEKGKGMMHTWKKQRFSFDLGTAEPVSVVVQFAILAESAAPIPTRPLVFILALPEGTGVELAIDGTATPKTSESPSAAKAPPASSSSPPSPSRDVTSDMPNVSVLFAAGAPGPVVLNESVLLSRGRAEPGGVAAVETDVTAQLQWQFAQFDVHQALARPAQEQAELPPIEFSIRLATLVDPVKILGYYAGLGMMSRTQKLQMVLRRTGSTASEPLGE